MKNLTTSTFVCLLATACFFPGRTLASPKATEAFYPTLHEWRATDTLPLTHWASRPDWADWSGLLGSSFADYAAYWQLGQALPCLVEVTNAQQQPLAQVELSLLDGTGRVQWEAPTGHDGQAWLWASTNSGPLRLQATIGNQSRELRRIVPVTEGANRLQISAGCQERKGLDLLFLLDATHSMRDEFPPLLASLRQTEHPVLLARDLGERYLLQPAGASPDFTQRAAGGGSDAEAVDSLLLAALRQHNWQTDAATRALVYITDAHPQRRAGAAGRLRRAVAYAAARGIQILPVAASGINEEGAYVLQSLALLTGGTYAWLENHPGSTQQHRLPLLEVPAGHTSFDGWLAKLEKELSEFNDCPEEPETAATFPGSLSCFPNPATDQTTLELPEAVEFVNLYNKEGRLLRSWEAVEARQLTFSVDQWPAGTYAIEAKAGAEHWRTQLVVAR